MGIVKKKTKGGANHTAIVKSWKPPIFKPDVFILETLNKADEREKRFEGRSLAELLIIGIMHLTNEPEFIRRFHRFTQIYFLGF